MCGIFGVISFQGPTVPRGDELRRLTDRLAHRGPDGAGTFERPGIALGHRRLAVMDPAHGDQPWISDDGATALVYNGEIYNHAALRDELRSRGHSFRTRCDTEVVAVAWREWGEACLERFDGMFAFAVVDVPTRRVFLARDRLGVKPLYYARQTLPGGEERLLFASEPTPILETPGFPFEPDPIALSHYLTTLQVALGERTVVRGLSLLGAGSSIAFAPGAEPRARTWWDVPVPVAGAEVDPGEEEACGILRAGLTDSVHKRLISDVPVGAFLSGGIDSTVVASLAVDGGRGPVDAVTVGFEDPAFNELEHARRAAEGRVADLRELVVREDAYFEELPHAVARRGLPLSTPNELPMYFMAAAARDRFPVALTGEGADELLAGYGPIHRSPFDLLRSRALEEDPTAFDPARRQAIQTALTSVYGVDRFAGPADHYLAPLQWIPLSEKQDLLTEPALEATGGDLPLVQHYIALFERVSAADPYHQLLYAHLKVNLAGLLLRVDAATMGAGMEARVPFTDHGLVEAVMPLPFHYKLRWRHPGAEAEAWTKSLPEIAAELDVTKYLLRRTFADEVPSSILSRPKQAFRVPIAEWLAGSWRAWARERVLDSPSLSAWMRRDALERAVANTDSRAGYRLWPLVNLALWLDSVAAASRPTVTAA